MFRDYDFCEWLLAGLVVIIGILLGGFVFFMFVDINNDIKAEQYCRELPFEEYQKDTRCHKILEG